MNRRILTLVAVALACSAAPASAASPGQYSLQERSYNYTGEPSGCRNIFVSGKLVRIEDCGATSGKGYTLVRPDRNLVTTVRAADKICEDQPLEQWLAKYSGNLAASAWSSDTFVGVLFALDRNEAFARSGSDDTVSGTAARKYTLAAAASVDPTASTTFWLAADTGLPLLMENRFGDNQYSVRTQWTAPVVAPQSAALFEKPANCADVTAMQQIGFASAGATGTLLSATGALVSAPGKTAPARPSGIRSAICDGSRLVDVSAEGGAKNAVSQAGDGGLAFRVQSGAVDPGAWCLLMPEEYAASRRPLPVHAGAVSSGPCPDAIRSKLSKARSREVAKCRLLGEIQGLGSVVVAEYARSRRDRLAAVALLDGDRVLIQDLAGSRDDNYVWRVDDGGMFDPSAFRLLFAMQGQAGSPIEIGYSWNGAEGESLALLRSTGNELVEVKSGFRHRQR
ncbi:MAG TPA: hypothetical protein VGK20_05175 [Candidatus Binatia bacterium]|jgi:hypothetical protein